MLIDSISKYKLWVRVLAQCIAGLQSVVADQLLADGLAIRIFDKEDGIVVFDTAASLQQFATIDYISNSFCIIEYSAEATSLAFFLASIASRQHWQKSLPAIRGRNFRLMLSDESQLVSGDPDAMRAVVQALGRATGLTWSPRGADIEFWMTRRRSGKAFFCVRLSRRERTEKDIDQGELRPELARLLCILSEPSASDIFLDPFSGSGAIGFSRARQPYNMIFLSDIDDAKVKAMKAVVKAGQLVKEKKHSPLIVRQANACALNKIENCFIDKVVTDPPWGFFDRDIDDLPAFYRAALTEICRVTKAGGIIVMLIGKGEMVDDLAGQFSGSLHQETKLNILVSGKKAAVVKWRKS